MSDGAEGPLSSAALTELRHDLRTPFNGIIGYTEMLMEVAQDEGLTDLASGLEGLRAAARELLSRVNSTLSPGEEVSPGHLVSLGQEIQTQQITLQARIDSLIAQAADREDVLADLERIRTASGVLDQLTRERLLTGRGTEESQATATDGVCPLPSSTIDLPAQPDLVGTVLVVDDNEANRTLLCRRLAREGCEAVAASDGAEAMSLLARRPVDLVLLDIVMPRMDGYEVLRQIKHSPTLRDIPVIMISAVDEIDSVVHCIEMGAEDHLPKPFDPVLLRARVGACLEKKRLRDRELEYLRGVAAVQQAASAVEAGTFEPGCLEEVAARPDELGRLARVFQTMAREVRAREQRLRDEVTQLRVEIDEARKAREVEEITGSDFFQDLQHKADRLRRRLGRTEDTP